MSCKLGARLLSLSGFCPEHCTRPVWITPDRIRPHQTGSDHTRPVRTAPDLLGPLQQTSADRTRPEWPKPDRDQSFHLVPVQDRPQNEVIPLTYCSLGLTATGRPWTSTVDWTVDTPACHGYRWLPAYTEEEQEEGKTLWESMWHSWITVL